MSSVKYLFPSPNSYKFLLAFSVSEILFLYSSKIPSAGLSIMLMNTFLYNSSFHFHFAFLDQQFKNIFSVDCSITQPQKSVLPPSSAMLLVSLSCYLFLSLNIINFLAYLTGTEGLITFLMYLNPCETNSLFF